MPVVSVNVIRYKAKCDICQKERPFEADSDLGAAICADSIDGWSWWVEGDTIHCKCRSCLINKKG